MEKLVTSRLKLGIISGGQLGKMLIQEASKWDIRTYILDDDENCPAGAIASHFIKGSRLDYDSVYQFGKMVDVLTFEIESVNIEALKRLKAEGVKVAPDPVILEIIQDKSLQKKLYLEQGIPTPSYKTCKSREELMELLDKCEIRFPFVQKLCRGGYDGRGVAVMDDERDLVNWLPGESIIEDKVKIAREISVIVARNESGERTSYPVVEMMFDNKANLVDKIICPSSLSAERSREAVGYAEGIAEGLKIEGLLAVELFIDTAGKIWVNESAPRPHNSGHHTIESIITSQFEQHLRAVLNLPLGSTRVKMPSVMINLVGEEGYEGPVMYEGLRDVMAMEGVKIHLYGKEITKPYRKMGHVTVLSSTRESALEKADRVKQLIKVKSWNKSK